MEIEAFPGDKGKDSNELVPELPSVMPNRAMSLIDWLSGQAIRFLMTCNKHATIIGLVQAFD